MRAQSAESLVSLPDDHKFSFLEPFLVTTQHSVDIGLVGWNDVKWTTSDSRGLAKKQKNRKARNKSNKNLVRDAKPGVEGDGNAAQETTPAHETTSLLVGQWFRAFDPESSTFYFYNEILSVNQWDAPQAPYVDDATVEYYTGIASAGDTQHVTNIDALSTPNQRADACSEASVDTFEEKANVDAHLIPIDDIPTPASVLFAPARKGDLRPAVEKYWIARYSLFSRWSEGVCLDEKSLFSVTPEVVARHHANMLDTSGIVVDAFCGCGGNAIQLAMRSSQVRSNPYPHHVY